MSPTRTAAVVTNGRSPGRRPQSTNGNGAATRGRARTGRAQAVPAARKRSTSPAARAATAAVPGETPRARGERTRRRVAEALISLLEEGDPSPTAKAVAHRAGVSVRLVFHHFEDMETLYRLVMTVQVQRHWSALRDIPADLSSSERIDRTVAQRGKLFDAISPVRRAAVALAARRDDIAEAIADGDAVLRERLVATFSPELSAAGRERRDILEALDAASSWEAWDRLRRSQHLSAGASRRAMGRTIAAVLAG